MFAVAWMVMMAVLPTTTPRDAARDVELGTGSGGASGESNANSLSGDDAAASGGDSSAAAPGASGARGAGGVGGAVSNVTRSGVVCKAGVRQIESAYSAPCVPVFRGNNGGATWRGIDGNTIKIVSRNYTLSPQRAAVDAVAEQAGSASTADNDKMRRAFVDHFNKVYELYGRKVVLETYTSNGNELEEVQNRGREQACADATAIAQERKAFAVIPGTLNLSYGPFSECAAEQGLVVPIGAYGFPESWYRRYHPYVWGLQMNCERISYLVSEYVGKRLAKGTAKWARDPLYKTRPRKFGAIGPDIAAYGPCATLVEAELKRYGVKIESQFQYTVDPARMSAQAAQAAVQFKADQITTLILSSDFLMTINLTRQAANQDWGPEWIMIGAGLQDVDNTSRLYDQPTVDGHMFGLSQLGPTGASIGPQSESHVLYKKITGEEAPTNAGGEYFVLVHLFNALQMAGPNLNPTTFARALSGLPPAGGPRFDVGLWSFLTRPDGSPGLEHTAVDDSREVYWDGSAPSYDGTAGTYVPTYGGRRFTNGQWPAEPPPIYPNR